MNEKQYKRSRKNMRGPKGPEVSYKYRTGGVAASRLNAIMQSGMGPRMKEEN